MSLLPSYLLISCKKKRCTVLVKLTVGYIVAVSRLPHGTARVVRVVTREDLLKHYM